MAPEREYRKKLADERAELIVRLRTERGQLVEYAVVLRASDGRAWRTVRVYDNAHGRNDLHRYTRSGGKQPAEIWHHGTAGEGLRDALRSIGATWERMIEGWER